MRICIVYDCLYPHTVGGAERWYRNLAGRLAAEGHELTYLTLRQWEPGTDASFDGVRVVSAGPRLGLYGRDGRRRVLPALVFGAGVLYHLVRHGGEYDVIHTASFPYFSLLAVGAARRAGRYTLVVDWHEVWTREYWQEYLGRAGGRVGWAVQRLCARLPQRAFSFSRLHARRLREEGYTGEVTVLEGEYVGGPELAEAGPPERVVVYAGRHIPEKRVPALVSAVARAREHLPDLRCEIYGDGPERPEVLRRVAAEGVAGAVDVPGFVEPELIDAAVRRALCLVLPSRREGYGLVVIEAAARGTPSVVVRGPDNAATELIDEGRNGFIASSAEPTDLAAAIVRTEGAGIALRESTAAWFNENRKRLALETSLVTVVRAYSGPPRDRADDGIGQ